MEITMSKNAVETLIEKVGENTKIALALINDSDPFLRDKGALQKAAFFKSFLLFRNLENMRLKSSIHYWTSIHLN